MKRKPELSISSDSRQASAKEQFFRQRRALLFLGAAGALEFFICPLGFSHAWREEESHPSFLDLSRLDPIDEPLLTFRDYEDDPDQEVKAYILRALAKQPALLQKIGGETGLKKRISVAFESLQIRLLFVPELRQKYADEYKQYCASALDYVLGKMELDNPYLRIVNPLEEYPEIPSHGITAYTVHQLGKQYKALCTLSGEDDHTLKLALEGAIFSNHLGAVTLNIKNPREGHFLLNRRNYSVWQNRTKNVLTLLSIPIEETFHFIMGQYTDRRIQEELRGLSEPKQREVQNLADHWMAIEEALVGGLVHKLLGDFLRRTRTNISSYELEQKDEKKTPLPQYKFRKTGMTVVKRLGCRQAIKLFKEDPAAFRRLVFEL
jgi:hypothetical protein